MPEISERGAAVVVGLARDMHVEQVDRDALINELQRGRLYRSVVKTVGSIPHDERFDVRVAREVCAMLREAITDNTALKGDVFDLLVMLEDPS